MVSMLPIEIGTTCRILSIVIWGSLFIRSSIILIFEGVTAPRDVQNEEHLQCLIVQLQMPQSSGKLYVWIVPCPLQQ
jgi:hypothetical protein